MRLRHLLAGTAVAVTLALGTISPASAGIVNYYNVGDNYILYGYDAPGSTDVSDVYGLTVTTTSLLTATVTPNTLPADTGTTFSFSSLVLTLEEWVASSSSYVTVAAANLGTTGVELAAGTYALVVTGSTSGVAGGSYSGNASLSPVPIPGAIVLFGSGLLGLVGFARRRASGRAAA